MPRMQNKADAKKPKNEDRGNAWARVIHTGSTKGVV
jgi:hypothetical protein